MNFFSELRRRNVIRVAGLYLVGAWLILQVAGTLLPVFEAPGWVMKVLVGLLAAGALPALIFSWVFELTPEGIRRESEIGRAEDQVVHTARKLDVAVIVLLLGIGALSLWGPRRDESPVTPPLASADVVTGGEQATPAPEVEPGVDPASIAVLPFADLSQAGDQAYFSDGISEEILNALVRVRGLQVASRTSSFGFKDQAALGVPAIAEKLAVRHVLEGSVRRAGDTLRITAQLIDAQTDRHLWSETYDRPLTAENVFAIQEEIATAIVAALKTSLEVSDVGSVTLTKSTANLSAYDLYLRARALFLARDELAEADRLLEQALEQDPDFARAWELRAAVNSLLHEYLESDLGVAELHRRTAEFAQRALALEASSSLALASLANIRSYAARHGRERVDIASIITDLERAIEIDPHNVSAMNWLGITLSQVRESERALSMFRQCIHIDPLFGPCTENEYDTLWVLGRVEEAYAHMLQSLSRDISIEDYANFQLLARFEQKAAFLMMLNRESWLPGWRRGDEVYEAIRHPERDHTALRDDLLQFVGDPERGFYVGALLVLLGAYDEVPPSWLMWAPDYRAYRASPQFRKYVENSGVLDYWRARGFPAQCRAAGTDSFECD